MIKTYTFKLVAIVLLFAAILTGCAKSDSVQKEQASNSQTAVVSGKYLRDEILPPEQGFIISDLAVMENNIYISGYPEIPDGTPGPDLYVMSIDGRVENQIRFDKDWDAEFKHAFVDFSVSNEHSIWLLEIVVDRTELSEAQNSESLGEFGWTISEYDLEGKHIRSFDLPEEISDPYRVLYSNGIVYVFGNSGFAALDINGETILKESAFSYYYPCVMPNGNVCAYRTGSGHSPLICEISPSAKQITSKWETKTNVNGLLASEFFDFCIDNGSGLIGVNSVSGQTTDVLNWLSCGVTNSYKGIFPLDDGKILYYTASKIYCLRPTSIEKDKIVTIRLGTLDAKAVEALTIDFNASNEKYVVEVIDYSQYNTPDDPDAGLRKLNMEIITGTGPDIYDLCSLPRNIYEKSGVLVDLYPYMQNDPELRSLQFVESIMSRLENDGKLFSLVPVYSLLTIAANKNIIGDVPCLNFEELLRANELMPERHDLFGGSVSKMMFLNAMTSVDQSVFWDKSSSKVDFKSETAEQMLLFSSLLPDEYDVSNQIAMIASGAQIASFEEISSLENLIAIDCFYNGEAGVYGFPCQKHCGTIIMPRISLGISIQCEEKEAAWSFLRSFLLNDSQKKLSQQGLPVTKPGMDYLKDCHRAWIEAGGRFHAYGAAGKELLIVVQDEHYISQIDELIDSAEGVYCNNPALFEIIWGEVQPCYHGEKTLEQACAIIQSKMNIYFSEQFN